MRTTILEEDLLKKMFELRPEGRSQPAGVEKRLLQREKSCCKYPRRERLWHVLGREWSVTELEHSRREREWMCVEAGRQQFML